MDVDIIGWAHSAFGKSTATLEELIVEVTRGALASAGLEADRIDEIFLAHFNAGFIPQDFTAALVLQADTKLRLKPATRVENACATGSAAVHQGIRAIRSGAARIVMVVGAEKMSGLKGAAVGDTLLKAAYLPEEKDAEHGFAGLFGRVAQEYFTRYGDRSDALAMIAAKNHRNGVANPWAQIRKDLGQAFCATAGPENPVVAPPLRRTDCSPVSDGAAALILAVPEVADHAPRAVRIVATAHHQDFLPRSSRDVLAMEGCRVAWQAALDRADWSLNDLSLVETHDCFTIAELLQYEAMGLVKPGEGIKLLLDGTVAADGRLPVNLSGGLKSKGHPIGATGVSMHVLTAMQLSGEAPEGLQHPRAERAGIFNMGGLAVANYVSLLQARRAA